MSWKRNPEKGVYSGRGRTWYNLDKKEKNGTSRIQVTKVDDKYVIENYFMPSKRPVDVNEINRVEVSKKELARAIEKIKEQYGTGGMIKKLNDKITFKQLFK